MKTFIRHLSIALVGFWFHSCSSPVSSQNDNPHLYETETFKNYWYTGKAEVNSYNLQQTRYGETREGKAVLIFLTEDISQKKLEDYPVNKVVKTKKP